MAYGIGVVCSLGVGSDRGGRERNEDNYLVCHNGVVSYLDGDIERQVEATGTGTLLAVCDGMGGHDDGHIASAAAVKVLAKLYRPGLPRDAAQALRRYLRDAHLRLHDRARERGPVQMGTTVTVCWLLPFTVAWAQVGDSRAYLYRDGELRRLTPEHTRNTFAMRDGLPTTPEGDQLVQSFIYGSRGLGDNRSLRLEAGRDSGAERVQPRDRLLLCTDGVAGVVDDVSLGEVLRHTPDPQAAAVACVERAIARGATDNLTALVVRIDDPAGASGHYDPLEEDEEATFWL